MSTVFVLLILPALAAVIGFSFYENAHNLTALETWFIDRARDDAVEMSSHLLEPAVEALRMMAGAEKTAPGFFRSDESSDFLHDALISAPQIDAVYVSFEDGFHRVVTRLDADRRRSDPKIPANANWHMSFIDDFTAGADRQRHRTFYETWPTPLGGYSIDATHYDVRTAVPQYQMVRQTMALAVTDPFINPDTGYPVIGIGYPIVVHGKFVGVASAHITFGALSDLLARYEASPNSITVITDEHGKLLAHPVPTEVVQLVNGRLQMTDWSNVHEPQLVAAIYRHAAGGPDQFSFELEPERKEYVALFHQFPTSSGKSWQVLVVTPTDDFVGELKRTNRKLIWVMLTLVALESALIFFMARRLSSPIEVVSQAIKRIRSLSFSEAMPSGSQIWEIGELQLATSLLANALRSFALFAPVGIIRDLIEFGQPLVDRI